MKILQLSKYYPPTHGGLELVAEFFSRASVDLNYEVTVLSLGQDDCEYKGRFGERVIQSKEDIKLSSSPLSLSYWKSFAKILKQSAPDVIFLHLPNPFAHEIAKWFSRELKENGTRVVGIYHSDIVNQVLLRDAYNLYFCKDLDIYDNFFCSSWNLKESSAILSSLSKDKVKVIPFCVDHSFMKSLEKRQTKFQGKFLTIGRMVPYKGYEFLIETFKTLPYSLTVVGNGPLSEKLKCQASSNVRFVGEVSEEEKFNLLTSHDALIVSSINRAEAYGMTIVEAFSVGLPVVASNIDTGVSFLVQDEITGFKFPINNREGLVRALERIAKDETATNRISQACRSFFEKELNYQAFKHNLNQLISGQ